MVMLDRQDVTDRLSRQELLQIVGGRSFSGTFVNALNSAFKTIYGFGQDFGGAIRRFVNRGLCGMCIRIR